MPPYFIASSHPDSPNLFITRSPSLFTPSLDLSDGESVDASPSTSQDSAMPPRRPRRRSGTADNSNTSTRSAPTSQSQASEAPPAAKRRRTGRDGAAVPSNPPASEGDSGSRLSA